MSRERDSMSPLDLFGLIYALVTLGLFVAAAIVGGETGARMAVASVRLFLIGVATVFLLGLLG